MITLAILHNIFLTREDRYKLAGGETVEVVGVSVPVWFSQGNTSEPANEVFCLYKLTNEKRDKPITTGEGGWCINMPQPEETLENMDKEAPTAKNLLDIKDGGSEWLSFRQVTKVKKVKRPFTVVHTIEIKSLEILLDTLT